MKNAGLILLGLLMTVSLQLTAQNDKKDKGNVLSVDIGEDGVNTVVEKKIPLKNSDGKIVRIDYIDGKINVSTHNENSIVILAENIEPLPERAKGLKPLYYSGSVDNTGAGVEVKQMDKVVLITGASPQARKANYYFKIPENCALSISSKTMINKDITVKNVSREIEIEGKNGNIRLENVTGPTVINTISGDIEVIFTSLNQDSPTSISSLSGEIDVTMPGNTPANLNLKSMSGGIFTDFDVKLPKPDEKEKTESNKETNAHWVLWKEAINNNKSNKYYFDMQSMMGKAIPAQINGGGVEVTINCSSGNIYLRKK